MLFRNFCLFYIIILCVILLYSLLYVYIQGVERVVFVGNYLCGNEMSMQMLAYAMEYWSQGQIKALFLRHEGYFGALGCLLSRLNSSSQGPD